MEDYTYSNQALDDYMSEITSRVVAETGIASDRYHLGKLVLQALKDDPEFLMQIDAATGESDTNRSVLRRSVKCATSFKNMDVKTGDVIILMAPNHLDLAMLIYAALFQGCIIAAIDRFLGVNELKAVFATDKPKMIFCQSEKVQDVKNAADSLGLDSKIISFDSSPDILNLYEMMEKYADDIDVQDFRAADFDAEETIAAIMSTSGTTGPPKSGILTHKNLVISGPYACAFSNKFPSPTKSVLILAHAPMLSALYHFFMAPILKYTRVQTSQPLTTEHIFEMINKYEPTFLIITPPMLARMLKMADQIKCNFSSFDVIYVGGSPVPTNLLQKWKNYAPNTRIMDTYALSELGSFAFYYMDMPSGSCGRRLAHIQYKLVDVDSGEEIKEPKKCGELWLKTPGDFRGYYNNPVETAAALTNDNWFKTGDVMYRDENFNFYYVERIKLLIKYNGHHMSPAEIETVIRKHPGVSDVAVTSVLDPMYGDQPIAFIVLHHGVEVSAQEIKDLVKENLSDAKQLRGGVVFLEELPLLTTTKVDRRKLKAMAAGLEAKTK